MELPFSIESIPERAPDQDERVTLLVLRKPAGSPDPDPAASAAALIAAIEDAGFDLESSYLASQGTDASEPALGLASDLAASLGSGE